MNTKLNECSKIKKSHLPFDWGNLLCDYDDEYQMSTVIFHKIGFDSKIASSGLCAEVVASGKNKFRHCSNVSGV